MEAKGCRVKLHCLLTLPCAHLDVFVMSLYLHGTTHGYSKSQVSVPVSESQHGIVVGGLDLEQ